MSKKNNRKSNKIAGRTSTRNSPAPKSKTPKTVSATTPVVVSAPVVAAPVTTIDLSPLVQQLRSGWAEDAVRAVEQLAASNDDRAVSPLVDVLANVDGYFHLVTRASAAMALGQLGRASAISSLIAATRDSSAEVSCEAILALGAMRAAPASAGLVEIVRNASGYFLSVSRHAAIRALGRIGDPSAKPVLEGIANSTVEEPSLVTAAIQALAGL